MSLNALWGLPKVIGMINFARSFRELFQVGIVRVVASIKELSSNSNHCTDNGVGGPWDSSR